MARVKGNFSKALPEFGIIDVIAPAIVDESNTIDGIAEFSTVYQYGQFIVKNVIVVLQFTIKIGVSKIIQYN